MTEDREKLIEALNFIDPGRLDYSEWTQVGMALKHEGLTAYDWEQWSARDSSRYHPGECFRKWESFNEATGAVVTAGTIIKMAQDNGFAYGKTDPGHELGWNDSVSDDEKIIDLKWLEGQEITEPGPRWNGVDDLIKYIETLFQMDDFIGTVTDCYKSEEGKWLPTKGSYTQTAGEVLKSLKKNRDIGAIIGDPNKEAGAWIRFNPLDGKGCKNENVVEFKYALVESDTMEIEKQNAIIRELELPVACLVYSGKKSLHAIVKIGADNYDEYRKRVDYLYGICKKNGLHIDTQNRNPSRLSRMPGVTRGDKKQFLVDTNIGKSDWNEWKEFIESANDDLPDPENLENVWDDLPELAPPLIDGVLRQGHKMLIAGPSKAGKSFALIELSCAIAEGKNWLGWNCEQGRVLYVNLELDRASCLHRFKDVYKALNWKANNLQNIDIWNLRGSSIPMDKLAPRLIRRASKKNFIAVIIDPIYKVITGDENSADQMAHFCNQFDKVCNELGCAVIYCHHHSKGSQGNKQSMDRASGSGVFARDPDALLDLIELEQTPTVIKGRKDRAAVKTIKEYLDKNADDWRERWHVEEHEANNIGVLTDIMPAALSERQLQELTTLIQEDWKKVAGETGWRIDGTLREFPKFEPKDTWFRYPVHVPDSDGTLADLESRGEKPPWQVAMESRKDPETKKQKQRKELEEAFDALEDVSSGGEITIRSIKEYLDCSIDTAKRRVNSHPGFKLISSKNDKGGAGVSFVRRVDDRGQMIEPQRPGFYEK